MQLPWNKKRKIRDLKEEKQRLQDKIEELEDEKESFRERFEAEKDRRSKLSTEKQEAEEQLNKLKQKVRTQNEKNGQADASSTQEPEKISLEKTRKIISKLESIQSPERDLTTIYASETVKDLGDLKGLKSTVSRENFEFISGRTSFAAFLDEDFLQVLIKTRPFPEPGWSLSDSFDLSQLSSFIRERKQWAAVSAGDTTVFEEKGGEILDRENVSSRIEKKQKKGGFSQGRFERKRDEQIHQHLKQVEKKIDEDTLLVGEERLCKKLPGRYLGGYDGERKPVDALYSFRLTLK